jgi:hypothetical protein
MFGPMEFIVIAAVVLGIILLLGGRGRGQPDTSAASGSLDIDWEAANDEQVRDWVAQGNKIQAIKRYRELTGAGLKDAKDAIDYLFLHPDAPDKLKEKIRRLELDDSGLRDLIEEGRTDEAVEVYRKFAGVDEYTARDAIDQLAREVKDKDE